MIYYRFIPKSDILTEDDYIRGGIGIDTSFYIQVINERERLNISPSREDYKETWDKREGYLIDGSKIETKLHPYHNLRLYDKDKKRYMEVDVVSKHHESGYVLKLCIREENTKSHAVIYWENISCSDPQTLGWIKEARNRYKII